MTETPAAQLPPLPTVPPLPMKIGHTHLKVRELERSIAFYTRYLGLHVTEIVGNFAFLTGTHMHHEIALQALGMDAPAPHPYGVGLFHIAFEVPDKRTFAAAYQRLTEDGVFVGPVNHVGISWAMYFNDPDGNGLEIYVDTRAEEGEDGTWRGRNRGLPPATILAEL